MLHRSIFSFGEGITINEIRARYKVVIRSVITLLNSVVGVVSIA